jgi:hypothetical protein
VQLVPGSRITVLKEAKNGEEEEVRKEVHSIGEDL